MSEMEITSPIGGSGDLATDVLMPHGVAEIKRTQEDIRLVQRAIRNKWNISPEKKKVVVDRLMHVVKKDQCEVMTKDGPVFLDGPADQNAVAASKVLVAMDQVDQTDHWNEDKSQRLDSGRATEQFIGVTVMKVEFDA